MTTGAVNYNTFISNLEAKGLQTTELYGDETNFQQYGEALGANTKQEIMQSFDNSQDYILQQQIAELFKNQSVMDEGAFVSACQSLGLSCSVEYESTSYISDYKAGNTSGSVSDGYIAIYTISDGKGGEIKIADANGNGSLECEELFMNEILGDISSGIMAGASTGSAAGTGAVKEITQDEFNQKVEEYLMAGFKKSEATSLANMILHTENKTYTGTYERVTQEVYNRTVEAYLADGFSLKAANSLAQAKLNVDDKSYTGQETEKTDEDSDFEVSDSKGSGKHAKDFMYTSIADKVQDYYDEKKDDKDKKDKKKKAA